MADLGFRPPEPQDNHRVSKPLTSPCVVAAIGHRREAQSIQSCSPAGEGHEDPPPTPFPSPAPCLALF